MNLYKNFEPAVSIILPTYNRVNLLNRAINSIIAQNFNNWELIIVDDGSTDSTFDLCLKYQQQFENIRYLRHSNRKLPLSLNAGILASVGQYITFLGSDDEMQPDHIKLRADYLYANPDVDMVFGGIEIIGDPYVKDKNNLNKKIHLSECIIGGTFFGKRLMFTGLNGFRDIKYSEDSEFYERAIKKYCLKKVTYRTYIYHRDTPDSITNTIA
ncbi:MAG: glycosyltransferase family 2 protein [Melioribacteraceae bacterium]|nr:glycosyltransferase family 2 protein [Melioribacteraceae bacterium]